MDFLKSAVASAISKGPLGAYTIAERVEVEQSIWTLANATKREGGVKCNVFTFDVAAGKSRLPIAKNAVRKCRTLHHPGVVKVLDTIETDSQIYIVTERLTPLPLYMRNNNNLSEETIKWGLSSMARTIKFINEEASSIHASVRASSVYVNDSGEWKLGGFDLLSSMKEEDAVVYTYSSLVPDLGRYLAPEVVKAGWDTIKRHPLSAVDAYGYGILISEVFNGSYSGPDYLAQARDIPASVQQNYKRLINSNPKLRLSVAGFFDHGRRAGAYFQTPLINVSENIESLGLKSEAEREEFLADLDEVAEEFPENFLKRRILPELLKSVEFGGGGAKVFSVVLRISSKLTEEEYDTILTPVVIRLSTSQDRAIRVCLLDNLTSMVDHLSQRTVNDKIFPNLVTGFTDTAPVIREQTVKSVLIIISKLSDRVINGELLKYLAKTANDPEPGIRTNTTICLGKIAKNLGPNTRSKVLVAAFTRSLRDPFVHARNAALLALGATLDTFSEEDCANKLLPAICPSLIDKERLVRDQANKTFDQCLARVRKHGQTLPETAIPTPSSDPNTATSVQRIGTPAQDSSWAGWAISSFTNKLSAADGQIKPQAPTSNGVSRVASPASRPSSSLGTPNATSLSSLRSGAPHLSRQTTETTKLAHSFTSPAAVEADNFQWDEPAPEDNNDTAWGAMNDDFQENDDGNAWADEPVATANKPKSSSTQNAQAPTNFDDKGEPDFAGWLKAQQGGAKTPKSLPKGITPKRTVNVPSQTSSVTGTKKPVVPRPTSKLASTSSKTSSKEVEDEGWGDAWE